MFYFSHVMKMIIITTLLFFSCLLHGQDNIIGVWLGEASLNQRGQSPSFNNLNTLLKITENNLMKVYGEQELIYSWNKEKDYYLLKSDSLVNPIMGKVIDNKLIVSINDYTDLIFVKIKNTFKKHTYKEKNLSNTVWSVIKRDSLKKTYHFLDSSRVYIKSSFNDFHTIDFGEWKYFKKFDSNFIRIINRSSMNGYIIKLDTIDNNKFSGFTNFSRWGEYPVKHNMTLEKIEFPDSKRIDSIEKNLLGNWISTNDFRQSKNSDDILFDKNLDFPEIHLELKINTFKMIYTGIHKFFQKELRKQWTGTWSLSKTGDFIELTTLKEYSKVHGIIEIKDYKFLEDVSIKLLNNGNVKLLKSVMSLEKSGNYARVLYLKRKWK